MKLFQLPQDPIKAHKLFSTVVILIFVCIFISFLVIGAGGYLYYKKSKAYDNLLSNKENIEKKLEDERKNAEEVNQESIKSYKTLMAENETLVQEVTRLEGEKGDLGAENSTHDLKIVSYQNKFTKIRSYNDYLNYLFDIIDLHDGFTGISQEEYQSARTRALATSDNKVVSTLDDAWTNEQISAEERLVNVINPVIDGIFANSKD
jgi:predicted nuclease with TOPRIM domain